ncbi:MAG: hypothetical protein M3R08_03195 [Bacteroidota bacterium]|nr:hypothetical protein [Bacteroidota bacterium]
MEKHLLLFPTMDSDHDELIWADGKLTRTSQLLLHGMTNALLYREVEKAAMDLLGEEFVRIHAMPVTHMDPHAQRALLDQTAKV